MILTFLLGQGWSYTGGPHGAWEHDGALAAIDFAPKSDKPGCWPTASWIASVTPGLVVRSGGGIVVVDMDGDGSEQTGWNILYMHIEARDRVEPGTYVRAGDRIGHPSCEGGFSNATHLHIARKYNGEWISADGHIPFVMDNWVSSGTGVEYDGFLTRGNIILEALEAISELNMIQR